MYLLFGLWITYSFISTAGFYVNSGNGDLTIDGTDFSFLSGLFGIVVNGFIGAIMGTVMIVLTFVFSLVLALIVRFCIYKEEEMKPEAVKVAKLITIGCVNLAILCIVIDVFKMFFATLICFALVAGWYWLLVCPPRKND